MTAMPPAISRGPVCEPDKRAQRIAAAARELVAPKPQAAKSDPPWSATHPTEWIAPRPGGEPIESIGLKIGRLPEPAPPVEAQGGDAGSVCRVCGMNRGHAVDGYRDHATIADLRAKLAAAERERDALREAAQMVLRHPPSEPGSHDIVNALSAALGKDGG